MEVASLTVKALSSRDEEAFVLWTAPLGNECTVTRAVVPRQDAHEGVHGAHVHVPGEELRRIAFDNYRRGEMSVAQIHTHPADDTSMSALDREWEVVTHPGALSIIVPRYCMDGLSSLMNASVYERARDGRWNRWRPEEFEARVSMA